MQVSAPYNAAACCREGSIDCGTIDNLEKFDAKFVASIIFKKTGGDNNGGNFTIQLKGFRIKDIVVAAVPIEFFNLYKDKVVGSSVLKFIPSEGETSTQGGALKFIE